MNSLFFGGIFVSAVTTRLFHPPPLIEPGAPPPHELLFLLEAPFPLLTAYIFLLNLFGAALLMLTLNGLIFFALPPIILAYRAYIWGTMLSGVPTPLLLATLPTIVLEGLAYPIAAAAGTILGMAWLKPRWIYKNEEISRLDALKKAIKESASLYVLVAATLIIAAAVEAYTIQQFL